MAINKRVHIVLFEYEPQFQDGRTVRMKALACFLANKGWKVTIYSLSDINRVYISDGIERVEIRYPGLGLVKNHKDAKNSKKITTFLRNIIVRISRILFPDRYVFSIPLVYRMLRKKITLSDSVIISMPSFSAILLTVFRLLRRNKIQLILDYRDLWVNNPIFVRGRLKKILACYIEDNAIKHCDVITVTTDSAVSYFKRKGVQALLVSNGISMADLKEINATVIPTKKTIDDKNQSIIVGYFGNLGNKRDCKSLLWSLINMGVELKVYGVIDYSHYTVCGECYHGQLNRKEALVRSYDCDYLLIVIRKEENSDYAIPGKVYESIALRKPILIYCPSDAIALRYLNKMTYPHFHINSEINSDLNEKTSEFIEYAKSLDNNLAWQEYPITIREHEFVKLEERLQTQSS